MLRISMTGSYDPVIERLHHHAIKRRLIRTCPRRVRQLVSSFHL